MSWFKTPNPKNHERVSGCLYNGSRRDGCSEVAGEFQVLTVPVVLLFVEGKEYLRKARIIQTAQFKSEVEKIVTGYLSIASKKECLSRTFFFML